MEILAAHDSVPLSAVEIKNAVLESIDGIKPAKGRILLLPPDISRINSGAGQITSIYYNALKDKFTIDVMPALGTHLPMRGDEIVEMFGNDIPMERFVAHDWRNDTVRVGTVPEDFIRGVSGGLVDYPIEIAINKRLVSNEYDLIISIGQVVPHEVAGMANYSKNILVGCGGFDVINKTHFLGAVCGIESILGNDRTPVRMVFDYAEERFLKDIPIMYVMTVVSCVSGKPQCDGLFIGRERKVYEAAARLSMKRNITYVDKPLKKVVAFLSEKEFKSTWVGNKAVYRTRKAIADGGELVVLAPGVRCFGEDRVFDQLIRKYGYAGRDKILELRRENSDLASNLSAAAHLIHGSADGRFTVTYAVKGLAEHDIQSVNYRYVSYDEATRKYDPCKLKEGFNKLDDGEEVYFINNPAAGLWVAGSEPSASNIK